MESDGSNWVIFKDHFIFAATAASLVLHIDGTGSALTPVPPPSGTGPITAEQQAALDNYALELLKWQSDEAIIRQAIA